MKRLYLFLLVSAGACHHDCLYPGTPGTSGACCIDGTFSDYCNDGLQCTFPSYTCQACGGAGQPCCHSGSPTACTGDLTCLFDGSTRRDMCISCGHPGEDCCDGFCPHGGVCGAHGCEMDDSDCVGSRTRTVATRSLRAVDYHCAADFFTGAGDTDDEVERCIAAFVAARGLEVVDGASGILTMTPYCLYRPFGPASDFRSAAWSEDDALDCAIAACGEPCNGVDEGMCP